MLHVAVEAPLGRQQVVPPQALGDVRSIAQKIVDECLIGRLRRRPGDIRREGWRRERAGQVVFVEQHTMAGIELCPQRRSGYNPLEQADGPKCEIDFEPIRILRHVGAALDPKFRVGLNRVPIRDEDRPEIAQPGAVSHKGSEFLHNQDDVIVRQGIHGSTGDRARAGEQDRANKVTCGRPVDEHWDGITARHGRHVFSPF